MHIFSAPNGIKVIKIVPKSWHIHSSCIIHHWWTLQPIIWWNFSVGRYKMVLLHSPYVLRNKWSRRTTGPRTLPIVKKRSYGCIEQRISWRTVLPHQAGSCWTVGAAKRNYDQLYLHFPKCISFQPQMVSRWLKLFQSLDIYIRHALYITDEPFNQSFDEIFQLAGTKWYFFCIFLTLKRIPPMKQRSNRIMPRTRNTYSQVQNRGELDLMSCSIIAGHVEIINMKNTPKKCIIRLWHINFDDSGAVNGARVIKIVPNYSLVH